MNKIISKVLKPSINGRVCYCRVPISRKIMGTGARDSEILINSGIPKSMSDLSFHLSSGTYSLDSTLANKKDYCASFSTTQLLQLLPLRGHSVLSHSYPYEVQARQGHTGSARKRDSGRLSGHQPYLL